MKFDVLTVQEYVEMSMSGSTGECSYTNIIFNVAIL